MKHEFSVIMHHVDPLAPRWDFVAGQWVKAEPSYPQDTNTDYVSVPYEELKWTPEEGFTVCRGG